MEVIDKFTSLLDKRTVTETFTALENFRNLLFNTLEIAMLVFHEGETATLRRREIWRIFLNVHVKRTALLAVYHAVLKSVKSELSFFTVMKIIVNVIG